MFNAMILMSRDSSIPMNVFDDPMVLFSEVKFPVNKKSEEFERAAQESGVQKYYLDLLDSLEKKYMS